MTTEITAAEILDWYSQRTKSLQTDKQQYLALVNRSTGEHNDPDLNMMAGRIDGRTTELQSLAAFLTNRSIDDITPIS